MAASCQQQSVLKGLSCGLCLPTERLKEGQCQPPEGPLDAVQVGVRSRLDLTLFQLLRLSPAQEQRLQCRVGCLLTGGSPNSGRTVLSRTLLLSFGLGLTPCATTVTQHPHVFRRKGRLQCTSDRNHIPSCTNEPAPEDADHQLTGTPLVQAMPQNLIAS